MINRLFPQWRWRHYATHPWLIVKDMWLDLKHFYQRGTRGYADTDVWSLDDYVSQWMPKALTKLKDDKTGFPIELEQDPHPLTTWGAYLDRMGAGFEAHRQLTSLEYHTIEEGLELQKRRDEGLKLFVEWYGSLWD